MDSEWIDNKGMDHKTHNENPNPWKIPRRYHRRKGQDGSTLNIVRRAHTAPKIQVPFEIPFDVEDGKHDL